MKKIFFIVLLSAFTYTYCKAQIGGERQFQHCTSLYFLDDSTIICSMTFGTYNLNDGTGTCNENILIVSILDGTIKKKIDLSSSILSDNYFIISNNCKYFVILSFKRNSNEMDNNDRRSFTLQKYSISEGHLIWEKEWYYDMPILGLSFNADDSQIIGVTPSQTLAIDSKTGELIKESKKISLLIEYNYTHFKYSISKFGRYFAFWSRKFRKLSENDDAGCLTGVDYIWMGLKWIFYLGSIPNKLFVWDIEEDKLIDEIPIPFTAIRGSPAFTCDDSEIIFGPFDGDYNIYSLTAKSTKLEFVLNESKYDHDSETVDDRYPDFKTISPNNKFVAISHRGYNIYILDFANGILIKELPISLEITNTNSLAAMAFSKDSKYFSAVTDGNRIQLYETGTWKLIWETEYRPEIK